MATNFCVEELTTDAQISASRDGKTVVVVVWRALLLANTVTLRRHIDRQWKHMPSSKQRVRGCQALWLQDGLVLSCIKSQNTSSHWGWCRAWTHCQALIPEVQMWRHLSICDESRIHLQQDPGWWRPEGRHRGRKQPNLRWTCRKLSGLWWNS